MYKCIHSTQGMRLQNMTESDTSTLDGICTLLNTNRPPHIDYSNPPISKVLSIPLTAGQAVRIHGWMAPSRRLSWQVVITRPDLVFCTLYTILCNGIRDVGSHESHRALDLMYNLQPNIMEWITNKKVALVDYEVMHNKWLVNPVTDYKGKVRIGEILQAGLSYEAMRGCNLSVDLLFSIGMTVDIIPLFRFSIDQWIQLGMRRHHVNSMTSGQVFSAFQLSKTVLDASLR